MPNFSECLIPNARAARDASATGTSTQTALVILAARAIAAATGTPAYTTTISVSGASSPDLQYLLENLHTCGYIATVSATTLTISWAA